MFLVLIEGYAIFWVICRIVTFVRMAFPKSYVIFFSELCWRKAMMAYTMPQQRKKEEKKIIEREIEREREREREDCLFQGR